MDMESFPLLLAKGHKLLDVTRGVEGVLGEGKRGMGRPLCLAVRQDNTPATRRVGLTSGTLVVVGLTSNRLRTKSRWARSMRASRSAQCPQSDSSSAASAAGQAQAGDAVIVLIRWFNTWSRADLGNCSHNKFNS